MKVIDQMEKNLSDELETQKLGAKLVQLMFPAPLLPLEGQIGAGKQPSLGDFTLTQLQKDMLRVQHLH